MQGVSMHAGCPVSFDSLRLAHIGYWDFHGQPQVGEMVVNSSVVDDVRTVFERLFAVRFPIRRMEIVDDFGRGSTPNDGANDFRSIEADNTSAFNCRPRTGSTTEYSEHSYGTAIDLDPLENPYVTTAGRTSHPGSVTYLDRTVDRPGMILANGPAVQAFASVGWTWGGTWSGPRDLQHFSLHGR